MKVVAKGSYAAENVVISNNATLVLDGRDASLGVEGGSIRLGEAFAIRLIRGIWC